MNLIRITVVVSILLTLSVWLGYIALEIPPEVDRDIGIAYIVFGVFNLIFYQRHARIFLKFKGKNGIGSLGLLALQSLFLGIGFILTAAGIIYLAK